MSGHSPQNIMARLLERETGQTLPSNRYWRIEMALKPVLRQHSITDIDMLASLLSSDADKQLLQDCIEAMINNETCFYRDQANFALLTGPVLDVMRAQRATTKRIRIWSAACSTGQEPYSLAVYFAENPEKWAGWSIQIFGSDISETALDQAKQGRYSQFEIQRGLPIMLMLKYFEQQGTDWQIKDSIKRMVSFRTHNLLDSPTVLGQFDLVLCRNMLMYLTDANRKQVLNNIADVTAPDGIIMLGAAETVIGQTDRFIASKELRGFYQRASGATNLQHKMSA